MALDHILNKLRLEVLTVLMSIDFNSEVLQQAQGRVEKLLPYSLSLSSTCETIVRLESRCHAPANHPSYNAWAWIDILKTITNKIPEPFTGQCMNFPMFSSTDDKGTNSGMTTQCQDQEQLMQEVQQAAINFMSNNNTKKVATREAAEKANQSLGRGGRMERMLKFAFVYYAWRKTFKIANDLISAHLSKRLPDDPDACLSGICHIDQQRHLAQNCKKELDLFLGLEDNRNSLAMFSDNLVSFADQLASEFQKVPRPDMSSPFPKEVLEQIDSDLAYLPFEKAYKIKKDYNDCKPFNKLKKLAFEYILTNLQMEFMDFLTSINPDQEILKHALERFKRFLSYWNFVCSSPINTPIDSLIKLFKGNTNSEIWLGMLKAVTKTKRDAGARIGG